MTAGDPGVLKRNFSATAIETTLVNSISSASTGDTTTSVAVVSVSGFPSAPFTLILGPDTSKEEVVTCTSVVGTTLQIVRGQDSTPAVSHAAGTSVRHGVSGRDFKEEQTHIAARGYDADTAILSSANQTHVHGLVSGDGSVVGSTQSVVLTRKTLGTGTSISSTVDNSSGTISGGTITTATVTASTVRSSTLTNDTLGSDLAAGGYLVTGLGAPVNANDSARKAYVDSILGSATAASTSAASAATSATSAATSATSAAASATASAASASAAATSASSALTSQTAAATSATSAAASATAAATSATTATTQATAAATSATSAAASATAAATSATSAAASATAAATSASSASTSASSALTSANSAATSAASAAAAVAASFTAKGQLLAGTGASAFTQLSAGTNGYILSANSGTATGLEWIANDIGDITAVTAGTGLSGGGTSGSVTISLDTSSAYVVPSQTGNSGKYLTTNGTTSSWGVVDALPSQTGNSGKYLTTNGTTASWAAIVTDPTPSIFMLMGA